MANMTFKANLLPNSDLGYSLGSSDKKWTVYGAFKGNADTATKLSNTPNNTTTFLRGDNTWSSTLTGNLDINRSSGEAQVNVIGPAGRILLYSEDNSSKNRGLYAVAHGTGSNKNVIVINTNNEVTFNGNLNGNASSANKLAKAQSNSLTTAAELNAFRPDGIQYVTMNAISGLGGTMIQNDGMLVTVPWSSDYGHQFYCDDNSYNLHHRYYAKSGSDINWGEWAQIIDNKCIGNYISGASNALTLNDAAQNDCIPGTADRFQAFQCTNSDSSGGDGYILSWRWYSGNYVTQLFVDVDPTNKIYIRHRNSAGTWSAWKKIWVQGDSVTGAVWNDYAEMRNIPEANNADGIIEGNRAVLQAGRCVREVGDGTMALTTARMQKGCKIISDTFGFLIGETDNCKTPIAVSGRALAYLYEGREEARKHIGDPVCSGPDGTISLMTDEEYAVKGYCCVGIISEVPDYEIYGTGNVPVDGRIWIYVK